MKTWLWFAVAPVALIAAHSAAPPLEEELMGRGAQAVAVVPVTLPAGIDQAGEPTVQAERPIRLAAFGVTTDDVGGLPSSKSVAERFALQSVLMVGKEGTAVIGGTLVRRGDMLGGVYRVAKIESQAVWLRGPDPLSGKNSSHVLRFPEYRDAPSAAPRAVVRPATGQPAGGGKTFDQSHQQILEMLKL
ncbi:MAG: hypothetical protein U1C96_12515 [Gallionella sp.]|nr:hypothetical protein [Gallionella sp.]